MSEPLILERDHLPLGFQGIQIHLYALILSVSALVGCQHLEVADEAVAPLEHWSESESGFRFLPGDEFDVRFRYSPEFNDRVVVGPDGRVQLTVVGSILVSEKSTAELSQELQKRYSKDLRFPELSVIPRSFGSETVYLGGEINKPGMHRLISGMRISEENSQRIPCGEPPESPT